MPTASTAFAEDEARLRIGAEGSATPLGCLALEQRPSGAHAAQEGDIARDAVCGEVFRCADRGAELLQHPRGGGDEMLGIDILYSRSRICGVSPGM